MTAVVISISWTAPTVTTGISGFNVYRVNGAPEESTKTLLAFVAGVSTTTYTYTGVRGTQYQFEVRATDGTTESDPLEIFYPTGTTLYTPTILTPTGNPMMIARDAQYLTSDEYVTYATGTGVTSSSALYTSGVLDVYLEAASEQVNRYCRRHFLTQTIDEIYQGVRIGLDSPKLVTIPLNEGPIQNVNRIDIQVLKWFITFDLSYLQVNPEGNFIQLTPFLGGGASGIPLPSAALVEGLLGKVWVNYTAGYDVIPNAVKLATSLYATKLIGMQENPVSAQAVKFGRNFTLQWDKDVDPIIVQANRLLDPYRLSTWRTP
jgi:hypothetical protein